jgi:hypothetical protein
VSNIETLVKANCPKILRYILKGKTFRPNFRHQNIFETMSNQMIPVSISEQQ